MRAKTLLVALLLVLAAVPTDATLIGDTVFGTYHVDGIGPNHFAGAMGSGDTALIGPGPEFTLEDSGFIMSADFFADTLVVSYDKKPLVPEVLIFGHALVFSDLDWIGEPGFIVGLTLASPPVPELVDFGFAGDSIFMAFSPIHLETAEHVSVIFDIEVHRPVPIPEPGTISLLGLGVAGLALRWRKSA